MNYNNLLYFFEKNILKINKINSMKYNLFNYSFIIFSIIFLYFFIKFFTIFIIIH